MKTHAQLSPRADSTAFPYYGELGTINLNTLTSTQYGLYRQSESGPVYSGLNYPVDSPGSLLVLPTRESGCTQEYRPYDSNTLYRRRYYEGTILWAWSDWCQEYSTENPPVTGRATVHAAYPGVGSVILWTTSSPPAGWLVCDGSAFSPDEYPSLAGMFSDGRLPLPDASNLHPLTYIIKAA